MAQRLPVPRINVGPQALRRGRFRHRIKKPYYSTTRPRSSSLTETFDGVTYLATGAGISHQAAPSGSWTDIIPAAANCAVVWMSAMPGSNDVATVTIGGVNAPAVSGNPFVYDATSGYNELQCFVLMNPPTGSKTVTVTFAGTNYFHATAVYYSGVGSVESPTFVTGAAGTQPSMTVTSTPGKFYAQAFAFRPTDGNSTFTGYSGGSWRALFGNPGVGYSQPLAVGDVASTGADTIISATRNSTSYPWGGVAIPLNPFSSNKWSNWGTASSVNGQLVCTPNSSYSSGVTSIDSYDLTGSTVAVQLAQPPNVGTGSIETGFQIACASGALKHGFLVSNGNRGHFSDDFNRADGEIGAAWSAAGSPAPVIYNNQFVAPTQGNWSGANSNSYAYTTDHQVSVKMGAMTAGDTRIQLNVRVGAGNMQVDWWDGSAPVFSYNPSYTAVATGPVANFNTGDIITFAALGKTYTLTVNGGVVMTWTDTDSVFTYDNTYTGTLIGVQSNSANNCGYDGFWFDDIGRDLSFQTTNYGVTSTVASITYDPINHDFLRFREAGGTIYYETSEDGSSWDLQTSTPSIFSVSSSYVQLYAGYWGTETDPGTALFDNLNLAPSNPVYRPIKPVSRKTGPMALRQKIKQRPRAGSRPYTSPRRKVSTFTESFDVLDPAVWMTVSGSPSFDSRAVLPCASTYSTIMSVDSFDLNESSVYINLAQTQAAGNGTTNTVFAVMSCCGHRAQFVVANGQLITSDTASAYTSTRAYNPITHRFLRIRSTGNGTLYWDISSNASTWIQLATKAASSFAAGSVMVYLSCGYTGAETNPLPAMFDGINLRPDWPNSRTTVKPVGRKVGPMALRLTRNRRRQQPYPRTLAGIFSSDSNLDVEVSLTAEATVDTFFDVSLETTASPVEDINYSPVLADTTQTFTVPGMEQATVSYDATGAGANSGATTASSLSWSHTATAGADVFVFVLRGGATPSATYDGVAMTHVGAISLNNDGANGAIFVFRKTNAPGGAKTVAVTFGSATYCSANSVSYLNVGAVTTSAAYAAAALTATQTITGADKCVVVNAIGQYCGGVDTFVSSSGGTQRYQGMGSAKYMNLVVQDTDSTGSTEFTSTVTATNTVSGSIGLVLRPAVASTAGVNAVQMLSSSSASSNIAASISWSHTIESDASLLVVGINWLSTSWGNPPVCTVNGLTMTRVVAGTYGGSYTGCVEYHYYVNPPAGTQTILYSGGGAGAYTTVTSLTFKNAKAVGATTYAANVFTMPVTAGPNDFLFNTIGGWINAFGGFQGYNQTVLYDDPATITQAGLFGYSRGSTTFNITALAGNYGGYGIAALPVKPLMDHVADANLAVTASLTAGGFKNANVDSSLALTASLTGGDKTNQVFTANQSATATADSTATRNAIVNASLSVTATLTDTATRNANVDSASQTITTTLTDTVNWTANADASRSITTTLSSTATRNAIVDAARALTATTTSAFWQGQRLNAITTAITASFTAEETEAATGATPLALTTTITAEITKGHPSDTTLPVTASVTAEMTKNLFLDASMTTWAGETFPYILPILLGSPTADMFLVKGFFITSVWTVSLTGTVVRNVGVNALLNLTTAATAALKWDAHAETFTVAITATPTAAATRSLSIDAALAVTATATVISSTNYPADSNLAVTAVVSSTFNADFLIDAPKVITVSATTTGLRRQFLDAPLAVNATLTDVVKWAAKFQATLATTATTDITGTRNAIVSAPLTITATRDQYLYQTEQFDVILVTTAGIVALLSISLYGDTDLAVTATGTADMLRTSYSDAALDVTTDLPVEAVRGQYIDTVLAVQDSSDGAVTWDSLAEAPLIITADLPALVNQGFLVSVTLDVSANTPAEVLLEALLDALLLAESMSLTANGIRDQYAEALQEILFTATEETQWNIKMEAVLVIPVSALADSGSSPIRSNFFIFYI